MEMMSIRQNAKVMVTVYDQEKYIKASKVLAETTYEAGRVAGYQVVVKPDSEIFSEGFDEVDPNGEYLIMTLEDGEIATFRNSLTDMFII